MLRLILSQLALVTVAIVAPAQTYKPLPPPGQPLDPEIRNTLQQRVDQLQERTRQATVADDTPSGRIPDVEVLIRAVDLALEQNLFYQDKQITQAEQLLSLAEDRLARYQSGQRGLTLLGVSSNPMDQPQLVVGGFLSRIDDSVQPFGLVIPAGYQHSSVASAGGADSRSRHRVDVWLHGRGDNKTEIPFLIERMTKPGTFTPKDTFVLHPFGRHCNAFKFAGETDVYEALEHLNTLINIDFQRLSVRGFSMGGAGCWHFAVHDPTRWMAANPGAGFVDTIVYQGWSQQSPLPSDPIQQKLLRWYDVLPWVNNLRNLQVVAYSGEIDKQRQAADRVIAAARKAGFEFPYVIGRGMGHKIDADSAKKIDQYLDQWAERGRPVPRSNIDFTTYTLRYHRADWIQVTGLAQHWSPGRVIAKWNEDRIEIETSGITGLKLDFSESGWGDGQEVKVTIDGDHLLVPDMTAGPGLNAHLVRTSQWGVLEGPDTRLRKHPGMQGPIDDAFCDRFTFVIPSRPAKHGIVQRWIDRELHYAQQRWQRLMRGDLRIVKDAEVSEEDIQSSHLICFGDFSSNLYLRKIASRLPLTWTQDELTIGNAHFDPARHAAVLCYPNPDHPQRYVVVNSGMTFREFSNNSNSRQIAMLPDWAILDVSAEDRRPAGGMLPGQIAAKGFFDERWQFSSSSIHRPSNE